MARYYNCFRFDGKVFLQHDTEDWPKGMAPFATLEQQSHTIIIRSDVYPKMIINCENLDAEATASFYHKQIVEPSL